jgi:putative sigma-54 modulation protein
MIGPWQPGARRLAKPLEAAFMQVVISGRHMSVSDDVKSYCSQKAERLTNFYDRVQSIEVILDGQNGAHSAELIVHADRTDPFIAQEQHADLHAAVDVVMDKVERQLRKHKEKLRNRKHIVGAPPKEPTE